MKERQSIFAHMISPEHLFRAWEEFRKGKQSRRDVQAFEWNVEQSLFQLHRALQSRTYRHGAYSAFTICDPKQRQIHKATVRDRIVHHAVFSMLNPIFEPTFIAHSFSCRKGKGTHKAVDALAKMLRKGSRNATQPCFVLKCDIHRFFASVDHETLLRLIARKVDDENVLWLLREILGSFTLGQRTGKGIPIGNLTSQLFANIYLNELDQHMKHHLQIKHYIRYTDDFIVVADSKEYVQELLPSITSFLQDTLLLDLHPHKVSIRKYRQGIDFLGYVLLPHHRVLRTKTKKRMFRKLYIKTLQRHEDRTTDESLRQSLQSYLGVLCHADAHRLGQELQNRCWLWQS